MTDDYNTTKRVNDKRGLQDSDGDLNFHQGGREDSSKSSNHITKIILENGKNYSTSYSRVISHHSTDDAITSLTSEIGRDPVLSSVYGRS